MLFSFRLPRLCDSLFFNSKTRRSFGTNCDVAIRSISLVLTRCQRVCCRRRANWILRRPVAMWPSWGWRRRHATRLYISLLPPSHPSNSRRWSSSAPGCKPTRVSSRNPAWAASNCWAKMLPYLSSAPSTAILPKLAHSMNSVESAPPLVSPIDRPL